MPQHKTRNVLSVFLASPSDVWQEREIANEVVEALNKYICPYIGWTIELRRWEDVRPSYGRPQTIINSDVDNCNLFVGLLWERWGQPTGTHSSGFHEEFERALDRRQSTGEPDIWLVFKTPTPEKLSDPGPELKKVMEFRANESITHRVLFKEIKTTEEWRSSLQMWLNQHLLQMSYAGTEPPPQPPIETPPPSQSTGGTLRATEDSQDRPTRNIPMQLSDIARKLSTVVSNGKLEFAREDADVMQEVDVARLYLLSTTWVAQRYTSTCLGTHEANLLYKHRKEVAFASEEAYEVLRSIVHDASSVVPGWFWFNRKFPGDAAATLHSMAAFDSNSGVRIGALVLLTSARISLPIDQLASLPLNDDAYAVASAAYRYLGAVGDESALALVDQHAARPSTSALAEEARFQILIRIDPRRAFRELTASGSYWPSELVKSFEKIIELQTTEDLIKGTASQDGDIRSLSVAELARRGELSLELAERLKGDASLEVQQQALQVIIHSRGEDELVRLKNAQEASQPEDRRSHYFLSALGGRQPAIDFDEIEFNYLKTLEGEEIQKRIDWISAQGSLAYKALGLKDFELLSDFIRGDIADGFERVRKSFIAKFDAELGDGAGQKFDEKIKAQKLDVFIRNQFLKAAFSVLAENAVPSDAELARQYLRNEDRDIRLSSARIICQFGGEEDVQTLLDISKDAVGELKALAPASAIRLSSEPLKLALTMGRSGNDAHEHAGLRWLLEQDDPEVSDLFRKLLSDHNEKKRVLAIRYFVERLRAPELEGLLQGYLEGGSYFYNVVTWLDRILYAPPELADSYLRTLAQTSE